MNETLNFLKFKLELEIKLKFENGHSLKSLSKIYSN
jgi:hypothetical protein